ncbi:uncharacterized protein UBRO_21060 [Ustilago bromivora]|uniref:Uncharacterized protein n=1 Tax=Ustilago bromivora TaxID=307758 RepID=A0A1K0G0G5_9BASI|nr:uncharacterized protein UBRO_21060 [Ustilago bromivora]
MPPPLTFPLLPRGHSTHIVPMGASCSTFGETYQMGLSQSVSVHNTPNVLSRVFCADPVTPSYTCVIDGNSKLLQSYTWLPQNDISNEAESDDAVPPSLQPYSHQQDAGTHSNSLGRSSFDHECRLCGMSIELDLECYKMQSSIAA